MKYRKLTSFRVFYDLSGRRQEEITQYQGFLEVADREGWQVLAVSEQIEAQMRRLCERKMVDAVVGNFVSEAWLSRLPPVVLKLHMGMSPLGPSTPCVVWDLEKTGRNLRAHLQAEGYERFWVFAPQDQPLLRTGLQAEGQFRTPESLVDAGSDLRNTVVVSPSDYGARMALRALLRAGRTIPQEIGIAGVGARSLDAVLADSAITSVQLPYAEKGRRVGEMLLEMQTGATSGPLFLSPGRILPRDTTRRRGGPHRLSRQLENWLLPNLMDPPPVEEWARRAGKSRRAYERAFSEEAGCTPYEFLLRLREREAKQLLKESTLSIARIGEEVGLPDPQRFSAFFKKRVGMAPSEWRRAGG